jgi:hypothetical protein
MSPTITVSDETFSMLQALAKPFVDTPESVIATLAEAELERRGQARNGDPAGAVRNKEIVPLSPDAPDDLTHTRLLSAKIDGQPLHRPKWNGVLDHMHILARERMGSFEALRRVSGANLREGKYEESGYRYLPDADLSIQGVDANLAWDHSLRLARALKVPIQLRIEWRDKEGAAHPGKEALLEWTPKSG